MERFEFLYALPVWGKRLRSEMNITLSFKPEFAIENDCVLHIAGRNLWQIFVDGELFAAGPARTAQGYQRVDELKIPPCKEFEIIVAGYNVNSYYVMDEPPYLQAELVCSEKLLAATGKGGFVIRQKNSRLRKVQRYSYQRPFVEVYDLNREDTEPLCEECFPSLISIKRQVPYAEYERAPFEKVIKCGDFELRPTGRIYDDWSLCGICDYIKGFPREDLECELSEEMNGLFGINGEVCDICATEYTIEEGSYAIFSLGKVLAGFIVLDIETEGGELYGAFDEMLTEGDVDFMRLPACSAVKWTLPAGRRKLFMFEPYSMQYFKLYATAKTTIHNAELIRFDFPSKLVLPPPEMNDAVIKKIYDAAVSSFRANVLDLYMDCPTRERAPWLCDSFFISHAEKALTGKSVVETAFLEHYLMRDKFDNIPDGMITSCYPADHHDHGFIPNWAMWYVLQLEAYITEREGDRTLLDMAKGRIYALVEFFKKYENSDGLLSKAGRWVLIDYSRSDELIQDINYPLNMLYCKMLKAAGNLYEDESMKAKAQKLSSVILEKSFDGQWFCDNAVYDENGVAHNSGECTEACQYYAFFCGIVSEKTHPVLWERLVNDFGPSRNVSGCYPEIAKANIFLGYMIRLYLLANAGKYDKAIEDIRLYFRHMAEMTETLWEYDEPTHSLNHGFTSFVAAIIKKCLCHSFRKKQIEEKILPSPLSRKTGLQA